jgi:hypothetical protein
MNKDNAKMFGTPGLINDSLTELLRQGARGFCQLPIDQEHLMKHSDGRLLADEFNYKLDERTRVIITTKLTFPEWSGVFIPKLIA